MKMIESTLFGLNLSIMKMSCDVAMHLSLHEFADVFNTNLAVVFLH
jgi:hypothetical protein